MEFTIDQKKIINARDCNLLVSAAAGSGKTAVMVERIVELITDIDNPIDIDSFLIVTFTNAAAAQMREKIADRIGKLIDDNPDDEHLQKQSVLIHNALITTIDSFCLYVLKNYFSQVDIEPGFRIADSNELKLLQSDVCSELLESYYASGDEDFLNMTESFLAGADDAAIESIIMDLYEASMSSPWPKQWLIDRSYDYYVNQDRSEDIYSEIWYKQIVLEVHKELTMCEKQLRSASVLALLPDGPYMYEEQITSEADCIGDVIKWLDDVKHTVGFDELRDKVSGIVFGKLPACRDKAVNSDVKERAATLRKDAKESVSDLLKKYLCRSFESNLNQMERCNTVLSTLCKTTIDFMEAFDKRKREKGILSFADCEHLALNILIEKDNENEDISLHNYKTTETARELRSSFSYVMIDEYQDSNLIQELLLSAVSGIEEGNNNRFMVGDVKQSIYRFRQAEPDIFLDKYDEYKGDTNGNLCIDLHQNFRSRSSVLDCTNAICARIMSRELGGVTYDDTAALHLGAKYPEGEDEDYCAQLLVWDSDETGKLKDAEIEAYGIAEYINKIQGNMLVKEDKEDRLRPVEYGDIVVLLRSPSSVVDVYRKIFTQKNIPVHVTGGVGFFSTYEIRTIMHLLRVIVNPLQDISLYGVMESFIGDFTKDEIALVRVKYLDSLSEGEKPAKNYLYAACKMVVKDATKATTLDDFTRKLVSFVGLIEDLRDKSEYMTTLELLWFIYMKTDYRAKVCAMHGGEKRLTNVNMLLKKATDYGKTSYSGLHNFIRYMDLCEKYEIDESETENIDENANVVRIMSIHKSKGLEFPVCFVAGMNKHFNLQDSKAPVVIDKQLGIGIKDVDSYRRIRSKTLRSLIISDKLTSDTISEELRILYVAFTRAKEKLILTGVSKDLFANIDKWRDRMAAGGLDSSIAFNASGYLDWMLMCIASTNEGKTISENTKSIHIPSLNLIFEHKSIEDLEMEEIDANMDIKLLQDEYQTMAKADLETKEEYIEELFSREYPHKNLEGLYTKTSVSELKHAAMPEETEAIFNMYSDSSFNEEVEYIPRFISGTLDKPGATLRGSAFHRILELLDLRSFDSLDDRSEIKLEIANQIEAYAKDGRLSTAQKNIFTDKNIDLVANFVKSESGLRMRMASTADELYREAPFMMGLSAKRLDDKYPEDETVLIQGIIDAYWKEEDGYVVLDYKTDRVKNAQELIDRYQTQLDYYEAALNQMHINVKEKLIYSFALNETIRL